VGPSSPARRGVDPLSRQAGLVGQVLYGPDAGQQVRTTRVLTYKGRHPTYMTLPVFSMIRYSRFVSASGSGLQSNLSHSPTLSQVSKG